MLYLPRNFVFRAHIPPVSTFSTSETGTTLSWRRWIAFASLRSFRSAVRNFSDGLQVGGGRGAKGRVGGAAYWIVNENVKFYKNERGRTCISQGACSIFYGDIHMFMHSDDYKCYHI